MKIYNSIVDVVGRTPLVRLNTLSEGLPGTVLVKLESQNPLSSVKDRIGKAMIEAAERDGLITKGSTLIEATSGNTGIALAFVAAAKGYKLVLTMPESMSIERRKLLKILGAELVLTPADKGMKGAVETARQLMQQTPKSFMPSQFNNPANPEAHRTTTAEEIWADTEGEVDVFVAGVGTGGTLTGVGLALKDKKSSVQAVAVEPSGSPVLSGEKPGPHKIQGIGAGFIPEVMDLSVVDEILRVNEEQAGGTARKLAREEGILCGISAGANVYAALELAKREENRGKVIVTVVCDTGERYLSTWLFDE